MGTKLKKQEYTGTTLTLTSDYLGSVQYLNGTSQFASTGEGRVYNNAGTFRYDYFMKDQVGNIRLTYTGSGSTVTVLQRDEYYPFGNTFDSYLGSGGANSYKFNGMEYQENGLNTIDFHARMYDPQIGRTFQPDPHADSYAAKSPFSFLANNPIMFTDPTGMDEVEDGTSGGGSDPGSLFPGSVTGNSGSWFTGSGKSFRGAGGFYAAFNARGQWRAEKGRYNWIDRMPRYKFEVVDRYKDWYEGSEYNGYHYKNTTYQGQYFVLGYVQGNLDEYGANMDYLQSSYRVINSNDDFGAGEKQVNYFSINKSSTLQFKNLGNPDFISVRNLTNGHLIFSNSRAGENANFNFKAYLEKIEKDNLNISITVIGGDQIPTTFQYIIWNFSQVIPAPVIKGPPKFN